MSSWKKNGGINNYDSKSKFNIDSLTVNTMSMKRAFKGEFDICGQLIVSGNTIIQGSLLVEKNIDFNGNIIIGSPNVSNSLSVYAESTFFGNISTKSNFIVDGNMGTNADLFVNGNIRFSGGSFLYSSQNSLGLNTLAPTAAFDISTSLVNSINTRSYNVKNDNVLVQNISGQGIVLGTDLSSTYMYLFHDHPINQGNIRNYGNIDSNISFTSGGFLNIHVDTNLNLSSPVTVGNRTSHPYNEIFSVYDISRQDLYNYNIYRNNQAYTGTSSAFISSSNESNNFIHIASSNSKGAAFGGGAYPEDVSRSMVNIGVINSTNNNYSITPAQTIVSGNSKIYPTTTGINTYKPRTDNYILDVNGPTHIDNGDINSIYTVPPNEIFSIDVSTKNTNVIAAVGSPLLDASNTQVVLYSTNSASSWNVLYPYTAALYAGGPGGSSTKILSNISVYDSNNWFISGSQSTLVNTYNGGRNWQDILTNITNVNFDNVFINKTGNTVAGNVIGYFNYGLNLVSFEYPVNVSFNQFINLNLLNTSVANPNSTFISSISANSNTLYTSGNTIAKYNISNTVLSTPVFSSAHSYDLNKYSYNEVTCFDNNFVIAVGKNIISSTPNGGTTWYDVSFDNYFDNSGVSFSSVFIIDSTNAISLGDYGNIWVSNNKGQSWNPMSKNLLNSSGKYEWISNEKNLRHVRMTDINTIVVTNILQSYNKANNVYGNSEIFNIFVPNFLNDKNNYVFDVSGSIRISGDIRLNNNGSIVSDNSNVRLFPTNVRTIQFGESANSISMGAPLNGNTTVQHNLIVGGNIQVRNDLSYFNGNVIVAGNVITNNVLVGNTLSANIIINSASFTVSDYRIKGNVMNLDDVFVIDNLRPVSYYNKILNKNDVGFIAHEVQEIFPFLVNGEKDGRENQSMNYIGLISILIKEVKELKIQHSILKNRLDAIEQHLS